MKNKPLKHLRSIAADLYEICFDVEKNINGKTETEAHLWAKSNAIRHAHTIRAIIDYSERTGRKTLTILNASGLACGHQDFSIVGFIRSHTDIDLRWVAFESPQSPYLDHPHFKKYLAELNIELELSDFAKTTELYGTVENHYDVTLFTEIAEHLDHSAFLNSLRAIRTRLKPSGQLILTTPNLVSLPNRVRFLIGRGDIFWGDGTRNLQEGLFGHIVNYDPYRLMRLMNDIGFEIHRNYSFTYGRGEKENSFKKKLAYRLIDTFSCLMPHAGQTLFFSAQKSDARQTPFKI